MLLQQPYARSPLPSGGLRRQQTAATTTWKRSLSRINNIIITLVIDIIISNIIINIISIIIITL